MCYFKSGRSGNDLPAAPLHRASDVTQAVSTPGTRNNSKQNFKESFIFSGSEKELVKLPVTYVLFYRAWVGIRALMHVYPLARVLPTHIANSCAI